MKCALQKLNSENKSLRRETEAQRIVTYHCKWGFHFLPPRPRVITFFDLNGRVRASEAGVPDSDGLLVSELGLQRCTCTFLRTKKIAYEGFPCTQNSLVAEIELRAPKLGLPVQSALLNGVNVAEGQDTHETEHTPKYRGTVLDDGVFVDHRPRIHKNDL